VAGGWGIISPSKFNGAGGILLKFIREAITLVLIAVIIFRERGEVIVFQPPQDGASIPFIKRVIGLPGETVEIKNGRVYVNGQALTEPYTAEPPGYTMEAVTVPADHYFVLGDNRNNANDSHTGWTVPVENILGEAWFTIWPLYFWGDTPDYAVPPSSHP